MEVLDVPLPPAKITDRFLAFLLDFCPFLLGFYLTLWLLLVKLGRLPNTMAVWRRIGIVWLVFWLLYQALGNASGGTFGKRFFGLRVEGLDGGRLGLFRALVRALGYLISMPLNLGFLWSLVHPDSRTWHDLLAGSRVVETETKSQASAVLSAVVCVLTVVVIFLSSYWSVAARPTPADLEAIRKAQEGLKILVAVEDVYKADKGRYTAKLAELARASGDVAAFKEGMTELFDPDGFQIETGGGGYVIRARALDRRRTVVELSGPLP